MPVSFVLASRTVAIGVALLAAAVPVHAADVYVAYDEQGMAHFAPRPLDDRYRLLFRDLSAARGGGRAAQPSVEVRTALEQAARRHGLDYDLLHAVAQAESGFNTRAISPKGAIGLMQIMPATGRRYGVAGGDSEVHATLHDLERNVDVGSRYLRDLLARYAGNTELALAAYNAGEGAVARAGNRIPAYEETQNYVRRIMANYEPGAAVSGVGTPGVVTPGVVTPGVVTPGAAAASRSLASSPIAVTSAGYGVPAAPGSAKEMQQFEQGFMMVVPRRR